MIILILTVFLAILGAKTLIKAFPYEPYSQWNSGLYDHGDPDNIV